MELVGKGVCGGSRRYRYPRQAPRFAAGELSTYPQAFGFGAAAHAADKMVRERGYLGAPDHFRALIA